ncbi:hypothetical protein [Maribacter sp. 2304DJ31-5]|uniref:hypothetical protein n=1 Tax=Maribacter sp. 2304DJ31-5 TaxID=3386273 RepID=UPI0039BD1B8F
MNTIMLKLKRLGMVAIVPMITFSCSDDQELSQNEILTQTEVRTILETDDVSGVADTVLSELYMGNTASGKSTKSNDCYTAEYSDTGYTVTFNNCVLNGTEDVNGTLTVTYNIENESASFTATFVDFYVGTIKINDTRTYSVSGNSDENSISFSVVSDMVFIMEDESTISENGTKTFGVAVGDSLESITFSIDGNWTLIIGADTYKINVTDTLEGNLGCAYLTTGSMTVDKNGLNVIVDFGDGTCDTVGTLTYPNGVEEEISLKD